MQDTCENCSAPLSPKARVCLQCGTMRLPTAAVEPEPEPEAADELSSEVNSEPAPAPGEVPVIDPEEAEGAEEADEPEQAQPEPSEPEEASAQRETYSQQTERSRLPVSLIVVLLLVLAAFGAIFGFGSDSSPDEGAELVSVYVSGRANARDQPSAEGSTVLDTYEVGTKLAGTWVEGASDASERWLKFEDAGQTRFIWDGNLTVAPVTAETTAAPDPEPEAITFTEPIAPGEAIQFVRSYVEATNSESGMSAADVVSTYYADNVSYFGKSVDRSHVAGEKIRYARRWPDRTYEIMEDTVQTDCGPRAGTCWVSGTMWYSASSDAREAYGEGYAEFRLGLEKTAAGIKLVSESSKVIGN